MRILIIDDCRADRDALRVMLSRVSGVEIVGEAGDFAAAKALLRRTPADLLLLDIELGRQNGFSLLPEVAPETLVVFTTVHSRFGALAFEAEAFDYHVKPVREERLFRTIQRALARRAPEQAMVEKIAVHRGGAPHRYVRLDTITAVIADGNYSKVMTGTEVFDDHRRLRDWEEILHARGFERLDRSHLVRTEMIEALTPYGVGCIVRLRYAVRDLPLGATACARLRELGLR